MSERPLSDAEVVLYHISKELPSSICGVLVRWEDGQDELALHVRDAIADIRADCARQVDEANARLEALSQAYDALRAKMKAEHVKIAAWLRTCEWDGEDGVRFAADAIERGEYDG